MGKIEVDLEAVNSPLRWMAKRSGQGGILLTGLLLLLGVGYLFVIIVGLLLILPILWLYDTVV